MSALTEQTQESELILSPWMRTGLSQGARYPMSRSVSVMLLTASSRTALRAGTSLELTQFGSIDTDENSSTVYHDYTVIARNHYFNYDTIYVCIEVPVSIDMHRVYNPNSGEHFYTSDENEYSTLIGLGWGDEGYGWTAPLRSGIPVYRLYNPAAGEHLYTTSDSERQALTELGWNDEGIGWLAADEGTPVYRLYNANQYANNHNFTSSEAERDEGIAWYGYVEPAYS